MWQTNNLTSFADPVLIDSQTVKFNLSAWFGGYDTQDDSAAISVTFYNQTNQMVGNVTKIGPVSGAARNGSTGFLFQQATGFVPVGARSVMIMIVIVRFIGGINDGYVDNIGLYLYQ